MARNIIYKNNHMAEESVGGQGSDVKNAEVVSTGASMDQEKIVAILGYIVPILFLIPLLSEKKSPFAVFHANQHLLLLIAAIAVNVVASVIPILGWFIIGPVGTLLLIVIAIMNLLSAARGEMKPLPIIGGFVLIK